MANAGFKTGDLIVVPVPRDNTGAWNWLKESIGVAAKFASIVTSLLTLNSTCEQTKDNKAT